MTEEDILTLVEPLFGSKELTRQWYETQEISGSGRWTTKQLVELGRGSDVAQYIAAVDAGAFR